MAMEMSLGVGLGLGRRITLVGAGVAGAGTVFGRAGLGVRPWAILIDAAVDGIGAGGDDGPVVVGEDICCACYRREECVGRVAVPAGGFAHFASANSPCTHGADASVSVLVFARGAGHVEEVRVVAGERLLNSV